MYKTTCVQTRLGFTNAAGTIGFYHKEKLLQRGNTSHIMSTTVNMTSSFHAMLEYLISKRSPLWFSFGGSRKGFQFFLFQFVPFRDFVGKSTNQILSQARLAKEVLAEIPDQLCGYMKAKGIKPGTAPPSYSTISGGASAPSF